jgi:LacI family transcriptional regulator
LDERLPSIGFDNLAAGQFAAEYLFGLGHQRVAVISGSTKHNDRARMRVAGVRRAYEQRGLDLPAHYVVEQEMSIYGGEQAISTLLAQSTPPSAVFCANDLLAAGALLQASKMGLSIPDELSICGMDNHELSSALYPALTTIGLPTKELGVLAAEYLLNRIQNKPVAQRLVLPFHLIERQSTGRWRKE